MRELLRSLLLLSVITAVFALFGADAFAGSLRTEVLTPGTFSKSTIKDQETLQLKLATPSYVERVFVAISFKSAQAKVLVTVNGRPRGEISTPLRVADLEIDVRDTTASIDFYAVEGTTSIDGVIAVASATGASLVTAPVKMPDVTPARAIKTGDVLRLAKKAERDLESLSRFLQPEENQELLAPALAAVRDVIVITKAGGTYASALPALRDVKTKLVKLEPIVTRFRAIRSTTERQLANDIYIWAAEFNGLTD